MNFINDDGLANFFDKVVFSSKCKLTNLFLNENNLTEFKASEINLKMTASQSKLFVDRFEKI